MKNIIKIILYVLILGLLGASNTSAVNVERHNQEGVGNLKGTTQVNDNSLNTIDPNFVGPPTPDQTKNETKRKGTDRKITPLTNMIEPSEGGEGEASGKNPFYGVGKENYGEVGLYNFLITIAKDMKNIVFAIVIIYFFIMVFRLLYTQKTEEEFNNFKKAMIWTSVGLIVMQSAYSVAVTLSQPKVDGTLGEDLLTNVLNPIIELILFLTGFLFLAMMVYSAYRFITANDREEQINKGKNGVIYSIIGYIMVKISGTLVTTFYGNIECKDATNCRGNLNLKEGSGLIVEVVEWMNSFILVVVTIIIIYAGGLMITSGGNEENMEKGKKWLFYALLGIFIVAASYTITIFFFSSGSGPTIKKPF